MVTTTNTPPPNAAQLILSDTKVLRQDMATILELARNTALPMPGESVSFLETVLGLLQSIVARTEQIDQSLAALHQKLDQPGIANVLRRMLDTD